MLRQQMVQQQLLQQQQQQQAQQQAQHVAPGLPGSISHAQMAGSSHDAHGMQAVRSVVALATAAHAIPLANVSVPS